MRRFLAAWRDALVSGAFLTTSTFVVTGVLAVTVMGPVATDPAPPAVPSELLASVLAWTAFALVLLLAAAMERALTHPVARALAVAGGVLVGAAARPLVLDGMLRWWGLPTWDGRPMWVRILTNVAVWAFVVSLVGVIVDAFRSLGRANGMLRAVRAELAATNARAAEFEQEARAHVAAAAALVRAGIDHWPQADTAGTVATFARDLVRPLSHDLEARAAAPLPPLRDPLPRGSRDPRPSWRQPPIGLVPIIYALCVLPYAAGLPHGGRMLAAAALTLAAGGLLADLLPRLRRVPERARVPVFLGLSVATGVALLLVAAGGGVPPVLAMLSLIGYPAMAVAAAIGAGALHARHEEQVRLGRAVTQEARSARAASASTRAALRAAAGLLHRDAQGACYAHLAAGDASTTSLVAELNGTLDRLGGVFDAETGTAGWRDIAALLTTWGHVIAISERVDQSARRMLDGDPAVARDTYDIVAEGLLNAVKHSRAAAVSVRLEAVTDAGGPALAVRIAHAGHLMPDAGLRPGSAAGSCGARLSAVHGEVVLEAVLPLGAGAAASVVV